jgi:Ceramidase
MSIACPALIGASYPQLCIAIEHYCERTSSALTAEPVNALTNAAFLVAAWATWRLQSAHPDERSRRLIQALTLTIAAVGLGSFLFHTVATRWAEWGDVLPIMVFMLLYLWLVLTVFFGWANWVKVGSLAVYFAATFSIEAAIPAWALWGGALYLPTLLVMIAIAVVLRRRQPETGRDMLVATGVFVASFAARTLDMPLCPVFPLGIHFVWHLLNAILLYLLTRVVILHGSSGAPHGSSPVREHERWHG